MKNNVERSLIDFAPIIYKKLDSNQVLLVVCPLYVECQGFTQTTCGSHMTVYEDLDSYMKNQLHRGYNKIDSDTDSDNDEKEGEILKITLEEPINKIPLDHQINFRSDYWENYSSASYGLKSIDSKVMIVCKNVSTVKKILKEIKTSNKK
jgi:hypothetical protein